MSYATENSWLLRYDVSLGGGSFCFKGSQFLFFSGPRNPSTLGQVVNMHG